MMHGWGPRAWLTPSGPVLSPAVGQLQFSVCPRDGGCRILPPAVRVRYADQRRTAEISVVQKRLNLEEIRSLPVLFGSARVKMRCSSGIQSSWFSGMAREIVAVVAQCDGRRTAEEVRQQLPRSGWRNLSRGADGLSRGEGAPGQPNACRVFHTDFFNPMVFGRDLSPDEIRRLVSNRPMSSTDAPRWSCHGSLVESTVLDLRGAGLSEALTPETAVHTSARNSSPR
jgi:hypothetical protein